MIQLCRNIPAPCGFCDNHNVIYLNPLMKTLLMPSGGIAEIVASFQKTSNTQFPRYVLINALPEGKRFPEPWIIDFLPLLSTDNDFPAQFFFARPFLFLSPLDYIDGKQPHTVSMEKPDNRFTNREWHVLFLALQRLSAKEIARRLNLAPRTVENRLALIYEKIEVNDGYHLRKVCREKAITHYIPSDLVIKNTGLI